MSSLEVEGDAIPATGNGMKPYDTYDTFLTVSHGVGNLADQREVHLLMRSNDGEFSQGWFRLDDLLAALTDRRRLSPETHPTTTTTETSTTNGAADE